MGKSIEEEIKTVAQRLLDEKKVDLVLGYEEGTLPLRTSPCFIRDSSQTHRLVWNSRCANNLAVYLPKIEEKVAIVAKGCDGRSIVGLIKEKQVTREQVVIIGVSCSGILDQKKIETQLSGREPLELWEENESITMRGDNFEEKLKRERLLYDSCLVCTCKQPLLHDFLFGRIRVQRPLDEYGEVSIWEKKDDNEKWTSLEKEISKCIRCYACRNACPSCYCQECFVDQTMPLWFGKGHHLSDVMIFHIVRHFHGAGRCVDCGACDRACPTGVNLRVLRKGVEKYIKDNYAYEAGMDLDMLPPLATFKQEDPQDFILQ